MNNNPNRRRGPLRRSLAYFRHPALAFWVVAIAAVAVVAVVVLRDTTPPPVVVSGPTPEETSQWRTQALELASPITAATADPATVRRDAMDLSATARRYALAAPQWGEAAEAARRLAANPVDPAAHQAVIDAANRVGGDAVGFPDDVREIDVPDLVGLTEQQGVATATDTGWETRTAVRDGEEMMLTMDYVPTRLNLVVENGVITATFRG